MEPKEGLYWRYFSFEQEEREEESSDLEDPEQPVEMVEPQQPREPEQPEQPGEPEQPEEPELPRNVENAENCTPSDNGKNQLNSLVLLNVLLSTEIFIFCKCFLSQIWPIFVFLWQILEEKRPCWPNQCHYRRSKSFRKSAESRTDIVQTITHEVSIFLQCCLASVAEWNKLIIPRDPIKVQKEK